MTAFRLFDPRLKRQLYWNERTYLLSTFFATKRLPAMPILRSLYAHQRRCNFCVLAAAACLLVILASSAQAQETAKPSAPKGYRKLAPGVETVIPPPADAGDTVTEHDLVEIQSAGAKLDWKPSTQSTSTTLKVLTKDIPFRRDAWYLQFAFKPLRLIYVDLPQPDGRMKRTLVWYLMYRVTNMGGQLHPAPAADGKTYENQLVDYSVRFFPQFVLETDKYKKAYLDRVLPLAVEAIQKREDTNRQLLDSVQMSNTPIDVSTPGDDHSVWGVATWTDIDPRIDFFSIYVGGLTNAYRFEDPPGAYQEGAPPGTGRKYTQKTLKLNFWRPGDEFKMDEREIYYGIPGQVDYQWVFR